MSHRTDSAIALVYFDGCPHVEVARAAIAIALGATGRPRAWSEYRTDDPSLPSFAAGFGSPSIFVGGREVTGAAAAQDASSCRIYVHDGARGLAGAPDPRTIIAALEGSGA
jgi:hypothetical protein